MNKTIWLLSALVSSAMFLFSCSSDSPNSPPCNCDNKSSSSIVGNPSSSSLAPSSSSLTPSSSSWSDPDLVKKVITLSSDKSYADIDGEPATYTKTDATSNLKKIDLIAYCGTDMGWCENNSIYRPRGIDLFWNRSDYIGGNAFLFEIPAAQADIFKTATKLSEIASTFNNLIPIFNAVKPEDYINETTIAIGKVFFVYSTEENNRIVIIKESDDQSVNLEIILIPSN